MNWRRAAFAVWLFWSAANLRADGMVVPQVFHPVVEIPEQQAFISWSDGVEHLVIETSFRGDGTNFAWVVPLPATPEVKAVSEGFFEDMRAVFQPRLVHPVHLYGVGLLFVCGVAFLAWRAYKDEADVPTDIPLCLVLAVGTGIATNSIVIAFLAFCFATYCRVFSRTTTTFTVAILVAIVFGLALIFPPSPNAWGLVETLGEDSAHSHVRLAEDVRVLGVQRAGVFDVTILQSSKPRALIEWLGKNGYNPSPAAEEAISDYVKRNWVFVASKVWRDVGSSGTAALHPLAFAFVSKVPVYPMRLTAVNNGPCAVDLYVFGDRRAAASHFHVVRSGQVDLNWKRGESKLRSPDSEVMPLVGASMIGTKLSATLTPRQMRQDTEITWSHFRASGATVYSASAAATIGVNVAVPFAVFGWLALGASRGGWAVNENRLGRWRWWLMAAALVLGVAIFLLLPKVDIVVE